MQKHRKSTKTYRNGQFLTYEDYIKKEWKEFIGCHARNCEKVVKEHAIIYIIQPWSNDHIFGYLSLQHRSTPWNKTLFPHNVYNVDTRVWYKWRLVSRGGTMSHKIIPFFVDYIVKKMSYWSQNLKDYPTFRNIFARHWWSIIKQLKKLRPFA